MPHMPWACLSLNQEITPYAELAACVALYFKPLCFNEHIFRSRSFDFHQLFWRAPIGRDLRRSPSLAAQLIENRRSSNSPVEKPIMKVTYFDIRGRAETARLVLAYAEVSYEDNRLPFPPSE